MCLIVDSNDVPEVFLKTKKDFAKLHAAVINGTATLVYGGALTQEYARMPNFRRLLVTLDQRGAARQVDDRLVEAETVRLRKMNICFSNDEHILALARVGRVRLICSGDANLRRDVRNPQLLSRPRGNIYNLASHSQLVRKHCKARC